MLSPSIQTKKYIGRDLFTISLIRALDDVQHIAMGDWFRYFPPRGFLFWMFLVWGDRSVWDSIRITRLLNDGKLDTDAMWWNWEMVSDTSPMGFFWMLLVGRSVGNPTERPIALESGYRVGLLPAWDLCRAVLFGYYQAGIFYGCGWIFSAGVYLRGRY